MLKKKGEGEIHRPILCSTAIVKVNGITLWSCTKDSPLEVKFFEGHWLTGFRSRVPTALWWALQIYGGTLETVDSNCHLSILGSNNKWWFQRRWSTWRCFPLEVAEKSTQTGSNSTRHCWITYANSPRGSASFGASEFSRPITSPGSHFFLISARPVQPLCHYEGGGPRNWVAVLPGSQAVIEKAPLP